jgi:hypothetical protein
MVDGLAVAFRVYDPLGAWKPPVSRLCSHGPCLRVPTHRPRTSLLPGARLATGLPGSALAGRVSHPLDDFSEFHESPHDFIPFRPALPGRTVSEFVWGARDAEGVGRWREGERIRGRDAEYGSGAVCRAPHKGASGRTTHPAHPSRFALARRAHPKGASGRTAHPTRHALRARPRRIRFRPSDPATGHRLPATGSAAVKLAAQPSTNLREAVLATQLDAATRKAGRHGQAQR